MKTDDGSFRRQHVLPSPRPPKVLSSPGRCQQMSSACSLAALAILSACSRPPPLQDPAHLQLLEPDKVVIVLRDDQNQRIEGAVYYKVTFDAPPHETSIDPAACHWGERECAGKTTTSSIICEWKLACQLPIVQARIVLFANELLYELKTSDFQREVKRGVPITIPIFRHSR